MTSNLSTLAAYLSLLPTLHHFLKTWYLLGKQFKYSFHLLLECEIFPVPTFLLNPKIYKYEYIFYKDQSEIEIHVSSFKNTLLTFIL